MGEFRLSSFARNNVIRRKHSPLRTISPVFFEYLMSVTHFLTFSIFCSVTGRYRIDSHQANFGFLQFYDSPVHDTLLIVIRFHLGSFGFIRIGTIPTSEFH
jgi:hypothetical protein